ncbi:hypothetical protein BGX21_003863 [Mortierella sp. AD011]|nr:hypothetical protein BGX20_003575 [Mortierella sp. AD010]KAF9375175.1 hypothetical protein BGX21_003863 [Mortierella sp. AD011]
MYSCFTVHIGRERGRGDVLAMQYQLDMEQCHEESSSPIAIQCKSRTNKLPSSAPATSSSSVPTPASSSSALATAPSFATDEGTSDDELEAEEIEKLLYDSQDADESGDAMRQAPKPLSPTLSSPPTISSSSKICPAPLSSSSSPFSPLTSKTKKRKANAKEPDMSRRTKRYEEMNPSDFWRLSSGRHVETVLFQASLTGQATFKMRSYTIDFHCKRTRALFTDEEWDEMSQLNNFELPRLPQSTIEYITQARKALVNGQHVTSVPMPTEDQFATHLYKAKPSPFGNKCLSETYWNRQGWPILKELLSDVDGITMVDGEKHGLESAKRKNKDRKIDLETPPTRKLTGKKLDLLARDTTDSRDWMVVESMGGWDEKSTKFLLEADVVLFKELHLIATHRTKEAKSSYFKDNARFISLYSGERGFKAYELRACVRSKYIMLLYSYPSFVLPSKEEGWKVQIRGLVHLLQIRMCLIKTIMLYNKATEDSEEEEYGWMYDLNHEEVDDTTLASSPIMEYTEHDEADIMTINI